MVRLSLLASVCLALSGLPVAIAGPACAKRHFQAADCVEVCKSRWGWPGAVMGTDPWGSVVKNTDPAKALEDAIKEACGTSVAPPAPPAPSSSATSSVQQSTIIISTVVPTQTVSVAITSSVPSVSSVSSTPSVASTIPSSSSVVTSATTTMPLLTISSAQVQPTASSFFAPAQGFVASNIFSSTVVFSIPVSVQTPTIPSVRTTTTLPPRPANTAAAEVAPNADSLVSASTSSADIQAYLSAHNTVRAQHGAVALTWNEDLAAKAQQWANGCKFEHSGGSLGAFGENLAAGTGSSYGIAAAVKSWTDEVSDYNPNNPVPSHFTQVVWKGTTQVGCAVQSCSGIFPANYGLAKYYVCEYSPQGNIIGRFPQNVQV